VYISRLLGAALTCVLALSSADVGAQARETGFLNREVNVDAKAFLYQVYVPRDYTSDRRWPVILSLHGGGEYGSDGIRQTAGGLAHAIRRRPERFPAIVVFPQSPADGTPGWHLDGGRAALAALDRTAGEFSVDPSRVYLTGLSAGGNGGWVLALRDPNRFAAALIICGWVSEFRGRTSGVLYPAVALAGTGDLFSAVAQKVKSLPIWLVHGDADSVVSVDESRRMSAALEAAGADVRYTELPGVDHNAWDAAYDNGEIIAWLLKQQRKATVGGH
jgi:predicted peptidase